MRTTMDLSDELLRRAKKTAADRGVPLRDLMEDALRDYLSNKPKRSDYRFEWAPDRGELLPGVPVRNPFGASDVHGKSARYSARSTKARSRAR